MTAPAPTSSSPLERLRAHGRTSVTAARLVDRAWGGFDRATIRLRWRYYVTGSGRGTLRRLPRNVRRTLGLDDQAAIGSRRIEVGGGGYAHPGYIHVDVAARGAHLEALAPAWSLPFGDGWADELLSVHALEHVHPNRVVATLVEWHRVLRPGGRIRVHVPNSPDIMRAFCSASVAEKWALMGGLLGMYSGPRIREPDALRRRSDHQVLFDAPLMRWALEEAGFRQVRDLTQEVDDRHTSGWAPLVERYSLVAEAVKPD